MPRKTKAQSAAQAAGQTDTAAAVEQAEPDMPAAPPPEAMEAPCDALTASCGEGEADPDAAGVPVYSPAESGPFPPDEQAAPPKDTGDRFGDVSGDAPDDGPGDDSDDGSEDDYSGGDHADSGQSASPRAGKEKAMGPMASFFQIDFKEMDKELSPEQLQEWQTIYASFRSRSIITGVVSGVDANTFLVTDKDTGLRERRVIQSLVIIGYRVKILIPETELWGNGETRPDFVARAMIGARISYVIIDVDRAGECAIASRRMALRKQQRRFRSLYREQQGAHVTCNVMAVGAKRCLVECGGYDLTLTQRDLSYTAIADLRREYHPGQQLEAVFKGFSPETRLPDISVKEINPNPFDGAELRHPVGSRRQAVISGKYAGGVFCVMPDGVTCLCLYSNNHFDAEFSTGERVLLHITQYDYKHKLIYARIITKW